LCLAASLCAASGTTLAQLQRITIGTNPAGTNFNVLGGGFAKLLQETLGVPSTVRPYSGSSVYLPLLHRGELTLGINSGIDSFAAFTGSAPYSAPMTRVRALMAVYPLAYMYWVRARSDLHRIEDLRGKRVVLNYRSLVVLDQLNRAILASGGLAEDDVEAITAAGLGEGARLVLEGRADAVAMGYRLPLVKQSDASMPGGLRFLTMGREESKVPMLMPGAKVETIVSGRGTVGIDGPIRVAVYDTYLNAGAGLSDEDAYRIVKALHSHWASLRSQYAVLADVESGDVAPADNPLPYHPGAVRYFEEAGLWSAANESNRERLLGMLKAR
jgi:TRAP transporter TAXI family solute receptor